jgi:2-polyprenyl-3-methyl-5-hydroxy-6-metoxy-1,4-benzoquinol methylase
MDNASEANLRQAQAWNRNAEFWDARMDESHDFFRLLVWPASEQLLALKPGQQVLDIACGNGVSSRALARLGAHVLAFDFAEKMIEAARGREQPGPGVIDYRILDATDAQAMGELGEHRFDAALCTMALMDIADLGPLMTALPRALRPDGRFVFSTLHPCFNNPSTIQMGELQDREGDLATTWSVKVSRYMTTEQRAGLAMPDQPVPQTYFHRSLSTLLGLAFEAGFVLDALQERAFPPENRGGGTTFSWNGHFAEIPPVLVCRLRLAKAP